MTSQRPSHFLGLFLLAPVFVCFSRSFPRFSVYLLHSEYFVNNFICLHTFLFCKMSSPPADSDPVVKDLSTSYELAADYWSGVPATVDGMLGGFGSISRYFLSLWKDPEMSFLYKPKISNVSPNVNLKLKGDSFQCQFDSIPSMLIQTQYLGLWVHLPIYYIPKHIDWGASAIKELMQID